MSSKAAIILGSLILISSLMHSIAVYSSKSQVGRYQSFDDGNRVFDTVTGRTYAYVSSDWQWFESKTHYMKPGEPLPWLK
jgi:hypothetical protein